MSTIHDNTANTWRDLADQLSPDQIIALERGEAEGASAESLLQYARKLAEVNIAGSVFFDIPAPADAIEVEDWTEWDTGVYQRTFTSWTHPDLEVSVFGIQRSDGSCVGRWVLDNCGDRSMTAEEARRRATAVSAAADLIERFQ